MKKRNANQTNISLALQFSDSNLKERIVAMKKETAPQNRLWRVRSVALAGCLFVGILLFIGAFQPKVAVEERESVSLPSTLGDTMPLSLEMESIPEDATETPLEQQNSKESPIPLALDTTNTALETHAVSQTFIPDSSNYFELLQITMAYKDSTYQVGGGVSLSYTEGDKYYLGIYLPEVGTFKFSLEPFQNATLVADLSENQMAVHTPNIALDITSKKRIVQDERISKLWFLFEPIEKMRAILQQPEVESELYSPHEGWDIPHLFAVPIGFTKFRR